MTTEKAKAVTAAGANVGKAAGVGENADAQGRQIAQDGGHNTSRQYQPNN